MVEFLGVQWCWYWNECTMGYKDWAVAGLLCLLMGVLAGLIGLRR